MGAFFALVAILTLRTIISSKEKIIKDSYKDRPIQIQAPEGIESLEFFSREEEVSYQLFQARKDLKFPIIYKFIDSYRKKDGLWPASGFILLDPKKDYEIEDEESFYKAERIKYLNKLEKNGIIIQGCLSRYSEKDKIRYSKFIYNIPNKEELWFLSEYFKDNIKLSSKSIKNYCNDDLIDYKKYADRSQHIRHTSYFGLLNKEMPTYKLIIGYNEDLYKELIAGAISPARREQIVTLIYEYEKSNEYYLKQRYSQLKKEAARYFLDNPNFIFNMNPGESSPWEVYLFRNCIIELNPYSKKDIDYLTYTQNINDILNDHHISSYHYNIHGLLTNTIFLLNYEYKSNIKECISGTNYSANHDEYIKQHIETVFENKKYSSKKEKNEDVEEYTKNLTDKLNQIKETQKKYLLKSNYFK